jgi:hypothetical protein
MKPLQEAYNTPVPIKWEETQLGIEGYFKILDMNYTIIANTMVHGFMSYKFTSENNNTELLNSTKGYAIQLIPTIKSSLYFILDTIQPNGIVFSATDNSRGRKLLYDKYCNELLKNPKWRLNIRIDGDVKMYIIYNSAVNSEMLIDVSEYYSLVYSGLLNN